MLISKNNLLLTIIIFVVVTIIFLSCSEELESTAIATGTTAPTSHVVNSDISPTPESFPNPTLTSIKVPSMTPVLIDSYKYILDHEFEGNSCQFPCWWGVKIGDGNDVVDVFEPLKTGDYRELNESFSNRFLPHENCHGIDIDYDKSNISATLCSNIQNHIEYMQIRYWVNISSRNEYPNYKPIYFLNKYDEPDDVWILYASEQYPSYEYALVLFYEEEQFVVIFDGVVLSQYPEQEIIFCPNSIEEPFGTYYLEIMIGSKEIYLNIVDHLQTRMTEGFFTGNEYNASDKYSVQEMIDSIYYSENDPKQCLTLVIGQ